MMDPLEREMYRLMVAAFNAGKKQERERIFGQLDVRLRSRLRWLFKEDRQDLKKGE